MANKIDIKLIVFLTLVLLTIGCSFFRGPKKADFDKEKIGIQAGNEKLEFIDGAKYIEKLPVINKSATVTWKKTKAMPIFDKQGQEIPALKEKLGYSYVISPIKMNEELSATASFFILIETTAKGDPEYTVDDLRLVTSGKNLDIKDSALFPPEPSGETGYVTSFPFGLPITNEVRLAFDNTYIDDQWTYMIAKLTLRNKKTQKLEIYDISLNSRFVHDLLKEVARLYPEIKEKNYDLFDDLK
ncbi:MULTISPECIES: S2/P23 family protein [unclassified Borrelia]|uniref:S2/P23 family protein n=1 Tax=unclassified Borrelia TaxID=2649934 RepID=UPI001E3C4737|nr:MULTISPECIES: S2/P23 family protein [unclassified Borrelia]UGQ15856.1 S2/P23 family protein [Borrelia sp. RT5S]UGQ16965.1 S2/P23 family protein [Borrelia sp. RT1S]